MTLEQRLEWARVHGAPIVWAGGTGPFADQSVITAEAWGDLSDNDKAAWRLDVNYARHGRGEQFYVRDYMEVPSVGDGDHFVPLESYHKGVWSDNRQFLPVGTYVYDSRTDDLLLRTPDYRTVRVIKDQYDPDSPHNFFPENLQSRWEDDPLLMDVDDTSEMADVLIDPPAVRSTEYRIPYKKRRKALPLPGLGSGPLLLDPPMPAASWLDLGPLSVKTGYAHAGPSKTGYLHSIGSSQWNSLGELDKLANNHDRGIRDANEIAERRLREAARTAADEVFKRRLTQKYLEGKINSLEYHGAYSATLGMPAYYWASTERKLRQKIERLPKTDEDIDIDME